MQFLLVLVLFLALVISIFTLQNAARVPIQLLFWPVHISPAVVVLGAAFLGGLAVFLAGLFRRRAKKVKEKVEAAAPAEISAETPAEVPPALEPEKTDA